MDDENVDPARPRTPQLSDVAKIARWLNAEGARYLVIGGFALIQHGFTRTTGDIDLLVEDSLENQQRVRKALESLTDKAILEFGPEEDMRDWVVLRVADEVVVDIMTAACGVKYDEAAAQTQVFELEGVPVPFASPRMLLRLKQTVRAQDEDDRTFLHWKIAQEEKADAEQ